jgi:hypothetical protein
MKNKGIKFSMLLAVILLVSMAFVPAVSAKEWDNKENIYVQDGKKFAFVTQDFSNPILLENLKGMREMVVNDFKKDKGKAIQPIILADPEVPEGASIVAYGFVIDKNGVPNCYVGFAGDSNSVPIIHEKAQEWYHTNILKHTTVPVQTEVTLTETETKWVPLSKESADYYSKPYGGITNNFEVRYLKNDNDPNKEWFAVKHIFAMEPGIQLYDNWPYKGWKNVKGTPQHEWSEGNPQLFEWDPLGTFTGTQTISVSISGGTNGASTSWGWSYSQPDVSTEDHSSTSTEIAKWDVLFNSGDSKETTGGMKPGSSTSVDQDTNGKFRLLNLISEGEFGCSTRRKTLKHEWNIHATLV